jgi:hypothetical protein
MCPAPLYVATVTSVIAEAAEYVGQHEAHEYEDAATPLAAALISAGARVEAMTAVVTLARSMLDNRAVVCPSYREQLAAALQRAETPPNTREHYEAMARGAQQVRA